MLFCIDKIFLSVPEIDNKIMPATGVKNAKGTCQSGASSRGNTTGTSVTHLD